MHRGTKGIRSLISVIISIAMVSAITTPNLAYAQRIDSTQSPATSTSSTQASAAQAETAGTVKRVEGSATAATQIPADTAATTSTSATLADADSTLPTTATDKTSGTTAAHVTASSATKSSAVANQSADTEIALTTQVDPVAQSDPITVTNGVPLTYSTGTSITAADVARQAAINESYAAARSASATGTTGLLTTSSTLPSKYDLRDVGGTSYMSGTRQQGLLGNCWAHAETAGVESNILKQTGGANASTINLSERQLSWNASTVVTSGTVIAGRAIDKYQDGEGITIPFGAGASSSLQGAQILTSWEGLASEYGSKGIPYMNSQGNIMPTTSLWSIPESQRDWAVTHLTDAEVLPSPATSSDKPDAQGNYTYEYNPEGTEAIKQALMENGGVSIAYCANQAQPADSSTHQTLYNNYQYGSSYIPVMTVSQDKAKNTTPDHSVCIVGWDDDFSADHFGTSAKPAGNGAFLCKNSWGHYGQYQQYDGGNDMTYSDGTTTIPHVGIINDPKGGFAIYNTATIQVVKRELQIYDMSTPNWVLVDAEGNKYTIALQPVTSVASSPTWDGYFWLSYYDATIMFPTSYKTDTPAANASGTYKYTHEYEYDYLGTASPLDTKEGAFDTTSTGPAGSTGAQAVTTNLVQAANVFTAQANEVLTAVSAVTQTAASTVQIFVYRLLNGAKSPTQSATGKPEITMTTTVANAGYHTINLTKPLYLHAGESFSVVEMIKGEGGGYLPVELGSPESQGHTFIAKIGAGESYISTDGGKTWQDVSTLGIGYFSVDKINNGADLKAQGIIVDSLGNVMIRALTNDWTPTPAPAPSGKAAAATTASYALAATGPELPKTGDEALPLAELLVLLMGAGLGTAACARRRIPRTRR